MNDPVLHMMKPVSYFLFAITLILSLMSCGGRPGFTIPKDIDKKVRPSGCATMASGVSFADISVCAHNAYRKNIPAGQPVPVPALPDVRWNQDLADWAQKHVNKCVFQHSDGSARKAAFGQHIGENLHASTAQTVTPEDAVRSWVSEAQDYDYNTNKCEGVCGHYTQVVWQDSVEIGCAVAICPKLAKTGFTNARIISCNYKPAGNYIGRKPY